MANNMDGFIESVEALSLADMQIKVDLPKVLRTPGPGRYKALALAYVQAYYWQMADLLGKEAHHSYYRQALVKAQFMVVRDAPTLIKDIEAGLIWLLDGANREGWFTELEYDDIEDMMVNAWEASDERTSTWRDYRTIVQIILPEAEKMGIPVPTLLNASQQIKKLRRSIPEIRDVIYGSESSDTKRARMQYILEKAADPKITSGEFEKSMEQFQRRTYKAPEPINSWAFMLPGGKIWFVIPAEDQIEARAIQIVLERLGEVRDTPLPVLIEQVLSFMKIGREVEKEGLYKRLLELFESVPGVRKEEHDKHYRQPKASGSGDLERTGVSP